MTRILLTSALLLSLAGTARADKPALDEVVGGAKTFVGTVQDGSLKKAARIKALTAQLGPKLLFTDAFFWGGAGEEPNASCEEKFDHVKAKQAVISGARLKALIKCLSVAELPEVRNTFDSAKWQEADVTKLPASLQPFSKELQKRAATHTFAIAEVAIDDAKTFWLIGGTKDKAGKLKLDAFMNPGSYP